MPGGALTGSLPDIDARRKWQRGLFGCERWVTDGELQWRRLTEGRLDRWPGSEKPTTMQTLCRGSSRARAQLQAQAQAADADADADCGTAIQLLGTAVVCTATTPP